MTYNLKILCLTLSAAFAASALLTSSAAAQFETEAANTSVTVSSNTNQEFAFTSGGSKGKCTQVVAHTKDHSNLTSNDVHTTWTEVLCHEFLGAATTFNTNGCGYTFHLAKGQTSGTTDIECPAGKEIEIKIGSICAYKMGSQTGLGTVSYKNLGSGSTREIEVITNITGITSTRTTNHFFCPAGGTTGTFTGTIKETGESAGGSHVGIWVD